MTIEIEIESDGGFTVRMDMKIPDQIKVAMKHVIKAYLLFLMATKYAGEIVTKETQKNIKKELLDFCERELSNF